MSYISSIKTPSVDTLENQPANCLETQSLRELRNFSSTNKAMGGSPQPILVPQGVNYAAGIKRRHIKMSKRSRRSRMIGGLEGSRRPRNEVGRRVKVLKKLIPSSKSKSMGLDGLFRDTADYILALEMRVKVMQIMVKALSTASDDVHNNKC